MADLNALIAQGAQFHAPVDPFAQYAKMQQLQQGQQANMLNQMKMDEYQRGIAEQNALRGLYSSGLDQASPEFTSKLGAISPTAAQAHQKSMLEASKAKADIAKAQEDVRTSQNKALGQGLLIALKDPSDAGLDQAFSLLDAQKIDTKPFRAQFANITDPAQRKSLIQSYVTGTEEGRKALEFVQPKPEKFDLNGKIVTIDINPNSPTFKQQITELKKGMSEYEQSRTAQEDKRIDLERRRVVVSEEEAKRKATGVEGIPPKELQRRESVFPQATSSVKGFEAKADGFIKDLEALKNHPGLVNITGVIAGRTPSLTREGRAAQALYDKIIAKGGFQALQDLRAASTTGGALGNVSNQEGKQLVASFAAIDQRQDAVDVQNALEGAIADVKGAKSRVREAYDMTYDYKQGKAPKSSKEDPLGIR